MARAFNDGPHGFSAKRKAFQDHLDNEDMENRFFERGIPGPNHPPERLGPGNDEVPNPHDPGSLLSPSKWMTRT